jgi:hypothetical protein
MEGVKVAYVLLLFLCALNSACAAALFYIYEWPASVVNSWPQNFTFTHRLSVESQFRANHGVGEQIDQDTGFYHTHQYSLFITFLGRLRESSLRTTDPSKASLFFIPYDIGMDATTRTSDGALAQTQCPRGSQAYDLLHNSTYFQRNKGIDHFMLNTINQMMLFYLTDRCRAMLRLCMNCVKLGIDAYPKSLYKELRKLKDMSNRWVSIPFPSNYHYSPGVTTMLGTTSTNSNINNNKAGYNKLWGDVPRWYHLAYIGSDLVTARKQKELRIAIRRECQRRSHPVFLFDVTADADMDSDGTMNKKNDIMMKMATGMRGEGPASAQSDCLLTNMATHDSMASHMFYDMPSASTSASTREGRRGGSGSGSGDSTSTIANTLTHPYSLATFCLMPGGDFPTRKGVLDALLAGCIPVVFQESTATTQWPWHWGSTRTARECMVHVTRDSFMHDTRAAFADLVHLAKDAAFVAKKRACIGRVANRMQYNLPRAGPFATVDAVDVVMARLLY